MSNEELRELCLKALVAYGGRQGGGTTAPGAQVIADAESIYKWVRGGVAASGGNDGYYASVMGASNLRVIAQQNAFGQNSMGQNSSLTDLQNRL